MDNPSAPQPVEPQEIIQLDQGYYVLATSALADTRHQVLKQGESFAVFDRYGDIQPIGLGEQGLYHAGTRFLSRLELAIGGKRPLLLSSEVAPDNSALSIDLTNPDVATRHHVLFPRDLIHVVRRKYLWDGVCHETLTIRNFASMAVDLDISLRFAADFRDLFEVRGVKRSQRGASQPPEVEQDLVRLAYVGRDNIRRVATITVSPAADTLSSDRALFVVHCPPGERRTLEFKVMCRVEDPAAPPRQRSQRAGSAQPDAAQQAGQERREQLWQDFHHLHGNSERFNAWHDRSLSDLLMMLTDTPHGLYPYAGVPWYSTAFGRDGLITAMQLLWLAPEIARGVLSFLAVYQAIEVDPSRDAEPGKIMHERRDGEMANLREIPFGLYYGSIDSTPLFIMLAGMYWQRTADLEFIRQLWPAIERALNWITQYGDTDGDGFVEYAKHSADGLVQQGWKDSHDSVFHADGGEARQPIALCEVQGYVYAAYVGAAEMARAVGQAELGRRLEQRAALLQRNFERAFWSDELGSYVLALDGDKRPCQVRTSNAGHALFTGIAGKAHARRCARALLDKDSFCGWGVRTLADGAPRFNPMSYHNGSVWPHDNSLVAAGLARYGNKDGAVQIMQALFDAASVVDLHRLPELYCGFTRQPGGSLVEYPLACAPQAWASGALFLCLQACLGLEIDARQSRLRFNQPVLPPFLRELKLCNLNVGAGLLDLVLRRTHDGDFSLDVKRRRGRASVSIIR
jgi:glycogen debranching enzyme